MWRCEEDRRVLEVEGLTVVISDLNPGKDYRFTVVTLSYDGSCSPSVSASVQTEVPQPENLTVTTRSSSTSVKWTKPKRLDNPSFSISLYAGDTCLKTFIRQSLECYFDLQPDTVYTVAVSTVLKNGKKSKSLKKSISTRANQEKRLQDLGLLSSCNKKLMLSTILEVSHDTMFKQVCERMKDLPLHVIRNRMWCNASSSCASVFNKKTGVTETVNPLDLTTAIFHCSDPHLQQTLCSKMSQCQLAVPLLLPNCDTQQSMLMLWALRDIVKTFNPYDLKNPKGSVECRIAITPMPLVSFVRLGNSTMSKSNCLNKIFWHPQQCNSTFVHFDMECGNIPRKISDGLVEISWFLPSGRKSIDVFRQPIAFANLRGDIRLFETQFSFLCQISAVVFVFTNDSETDVSILTNKDRTSQMYLVIPHKSKSKADSLAEVAGKMKMVDVIIKGEQNETGFITTLRKFTADIVQKQKHLTSVEEMAEIAQKTGLHIDESLTECGKVAKLANNILTGIKDIAKFKDKNLPCQGHMWKEISSLEREKCQLKRSEREDIEQYKSELSKKVNNLRAKQRETEISRYMTHFIDGISNSETETSYFLKALRMSLHSLMDVQMLSEQISQCSLGLEHFFRELGQLYESAALDPETPRAKQLQHLPSVCANLLLEGFPLELLDGDASNISQRWIEDIFNSLHNLVQPNCVISVVTVLGVQSTGKSTLLNTMFGMQFAVSSGKCTRGAFMQLVKVSDSSRHELKCDFILIIDTEGLKSPELAEQEDSYVHDNELATLVIGLSDVTIINISTENGTEMKDILQIAVHAFLRMKEVGKKPRCLFAHQNAGDVAAHAKNVLGRKKLIQLLNDMTESAAKMEKRNANICFTDVMDYDPDKDSYYIPGLWQGSPPMASVSAGYSEAVGELKKGLISALIELQFERHDLLLFWRLVKEVWQAVRFENFIFNFKNSLDAEAYSNLCQMWNGWEWEFQKEMHKWSVTAEVQILNCGMTESDYEIPYFETLRLMASQQLDEAEEKIRNSLKHYFDNSSNKLYLIEKYRAEFEISVESLRRKEQASMECCLRAALDIQNGSKKLRQINNTQSQKTETKVLDLLKSCKGNDTDGCDEMLTKEFENMWKSTQSEFRYSPLPRKNVTSDAFHILKRNFRTFPGHIQKLLIEDNLPECGKSFKLDEMSSEKHWKVVPRKNNKWLLRRRGRRQKEKTKLQNTARSYLLCVKTAGENFIFAIRMQKQDYKQAHLNQLLHKIDEELQRYDIKFDDEVEASMKMHLFGIAAGAFQTMHNNFINQNDPQICLERAREKFYLEFVNLYHDRDQCHRKAAEFANNCLKPAVLDYIQKRIGQEIVDEMKNGNDAESFSSRPLFQYRLLYDLLVENKYENYKRFIDCYETYVEDWILKQVVQTMSKKNRLQRMEQNLIDNVLKKILDTITSCKCNPGSVGNLTAFIKHLCGAVGLILPDGALRNVLIMNSAFQNSIEEFADHLKVHIQDMRQTLCVPYENKDDIIKRLQSLPLKPQEVLFKALIGCGQICPFCHAPCDADGTEHEKHTVSIHRPQGISLWNSIDSKVIITAICSSSVISDNVFQTDETVNSYPFKEYREVYPDWEITGDASIEATAYWKFFMANFNEQIAQDCGLNPATIPDDWKALKEEDAIKSLQDAFHKFQRTLSRRNLHRHYH
ncbi:interferon-induced very large GTPase 1-like [Engraulis encrasicolus]|uniref:interferon-induced very large GTPase 1-like n=1 Tax=Engraulis encrasicolus TaxID=184585 RepID=UPI002FD5640E